MYEMCVLVAEVDKKSKKMRDAEKFDVPVVSEDYLEAVKKGGAKLMISQHSIASWGDKKVYHFVYNLAVVMFHHFWGGRVASRLVSLTLD